MNVLSKLAINSLRYRKFSVFLSVFSIAVSVTLLLGVERVRYQVKESFSNTISGTDLIVGARTGDVSLLLSSVFHFGNAHQNVSFDTYQAIAALPKVSWAIPLSLGDSYKGYTVLGTTEAYFDHFNYGKHQLLKAANGNLHLHHTEAILGAKVALELYSKIGDTIAITHGMGSEDFISHADEPFIVNGILEPTGTPVDRVIHVSMSAMSDIHTHFYREDEAVDDPLHFGAEELAKLTQAGHDGHDHSLGGHAEFDGDNSESLSAFLLGLKDERDVLSLQRELNNYKMEALTAILPVVTLTDLWMIITPIEKALLIISLMVLLVTFAGMLTTLMTSLQERRREMAVLRSVGANVYQIFRLMIIETAGVSGLGIIMGCILTYFLLYVFKPIIALHFGIVFQIEWIRTSEWILLALIWFGGILTGVWPAYRSYKASLADGLMIKI